MVKNKGSEIYYKCQCSCGVIKEIDAHNLCNGLNKSCTHNYSKRNTKFTRKQKIFEVDPNLTNQLNFECNTYENVEDLVITSSTEVSQKCSSKHIYLNTIENKTKSSKCLIRSKRQLSVGHNDAQTWCKQNNRQDLLDEWASSNEIKPNQVTAGSRERIIWNCSKCGHEWEALIYARLKQNTGCPRCTRRYSTSFPEQAVFYYIKQYFNDAENGNRKVLDGKELDIYIPSLSVAIEYDGEKWHKNKYKDRAKDFLCAEKGIVLYRIRENSNDKHNCIDDNLYKSDNSLIYNYSYTDWDRLNSIIYDILTDLKPNKVYDINIERDKLHIKESYHYAVLKKSLASLYPNIAAEWHPINNGRIKPNMIPAESHDSFDWLCPKGHTYTAMVKNRVRMNSGCPYCTGQKVLKGFNDLETTHPEHALDYDNIKNVRKSHEISYGCSDYVWWKCHKCGYEFKYMLNMYLKTKMACPSCTKKGKTKFKKVLKYETQELFDTLAEAAKSLNIKEGEVTKYYKNIFNACSGNTKSAYGYHWFYVLTDSYGNVIEDISKFKIDNTFINNHYKSHVGKTYKMSYGQTATIIRDGGGKDVDIRFNDGTIVTNCNRSKVKAGKVKNPNYIKLPKEPKEPKVTKKAEIAKAPKKAKLRTTYIGKTNTMKHNLVATVIEDFGYNNITIMFEDGTIITNVTRRAFNNGTILHPKWWKTYLNSTKQMKCGLDCTIIEMINENQITVKFTNGDIVKTTLRKFMNSAVLTTALSHNYKHRNIGERRKMNCGEFATIIADRGTHDIDVQFDDGVIIKHRDRSAFDKGCIKHPKTVTNYVGKSKIMKCGLMATVIEDKGWKDITVQFEDGLIVYHKRRSHFDIGNIKHG